MEMKTFIEIGTCDFDTCLPLIESGEWIGVMCEPAPTYFNNLKNMCANVANKENLFLQNVAITDYKGHVSFAESKETDIPENLWQRGISSIVQDHHKGERLFDLEGNQPLIKQILDVPCTTLDHLIRQYSLDSIDYLKIDTEGHEINILDNYSWELKPTFIKLEHTHIDDQYVSAMLKDKGYIVYTEQRDMYAIA